MAKIMDIRALALNGQRAFRQLDATVPEWDNARVILREPAAEAWLRWQDIIKPKTDGEDDAETLTVAERAHRNLQADVVLFVNVLCSDDGERVFTDADIPEVESVYGPVHARLLRQALGLMADPDDVKKN